MTKKVAFILFIIVLLFTSLSAGALASSLPEADVKYQVSSDSWEQGSLSDAAAGVMDGGSIILLRDADVAGEIKFTGNKTITLLGEGHTLSLKHSISVSGQTVLNLGAADYTHTLTIKSLDDTRAIIGLSGSSVLNMYDNVTLGPSRSGGQCAGVQLQDNSVFNMYGGLITECVNWASVSGAVLVTEFSAFNMFDGVIDKCSGWNGGAIGVSPSGVIGQDPEQHPNLNISGGTISNCIDSWLGGGAICYYSSKPAFIDISGLTIISCSADSEDDGYGGAIFIYTTSSEASFTISDTEITNCSANYGGGIFLYKGSLTIADDVRIHNNSASKAGDDLYFNGSVPTFFDPPGGLVLNATGKSIEGWHIDGEKAGTGTPRWTLGGEGVEPYITPISAQDVEAGTALKAAHGDVVSYTIEVSVNDPDFGTAYADLTSAEAGTTISLTATPKDGYSFAGWQVVSGNIQITNNKFVMPEENVKVIAVFEKEVPPYIPPIIPPEEPDDAEYSPNWLNTTEHFAYIIGYEDGTVRPDAGITRAEVATIFFRLLTDEARESFWSDTNDYSDVADGSWYNIAVSTLSNMGILGGYEDGTFRPNAPITRAEFAKIAVSFFDHEAIEAVNGFTDVARGAWYENYVAVASEIGLIEGYGGNVFRPEAAITRAEACAIINRTLGRAPDAEHLLPESQMNTWPDNSDTGVWYYAHIQEATNSHEYSWSGDIEQWTEKLPEPDWDALQR